MNMKKIKTFYNKNFYVKKIQKEIFLLYLVAFSNNSNYNNNRNNNKIIK